MTWRALRAAAMVAFALAVGLRAFAADDAGPTTVTADTARLTFFVSPLSSQGTVAEQAPSAASSLRVGVNGARVVMLRIFVAGEGDLSEAASAARATLPSGSSAVVSAIRVGALPGGARAVVESVSESPTAVNPNGLVFISGQLTTGAAQSGQPPIPVAPLAEKSIANLQTALTVVQLEGRDVLRVTCFTSSLTDEPRVQAMVREAFPSAILNTMQIERAPANAEVECEAVARLRTKPAEPVRLVNPTNAAFAQAVVVDAPRMLFSSIVTSDGDEAGVRAGLSTLTRSLTAAGTAASRVFYVYGYPTSQATLQAFRNVRWEFFDRSRAPASTNLVFEGGSSAGSLGVSVIAVAGQ